MKPVSRKYLIRVRNFQHWLSAKLILLLLKFLRLFPAKPALNFAGWAARKIGPFTSRHRIALDNIRRAMPELTESACRNIALDMWDNMGRLTAEYVFLDKLADFIREGEAGPNIEWEGVEIFERVRSENKPHIFFTAHLGNFELLPVAAERFGLSMTVLFRPPNNPYIADEVSKLRNINSSNMLASRVGATFSLARILDQGGNIGALVDQKFQKGIKSRFFGRACRTNPLLAKLARHYECAIHPCFCLRLPDNRFRIAFLEKIDPPLDKSGQLDVEATAQMFNDIVEDWVRKDPGQWMWFHRRWIG